MIRLLILGASCLALAAQPASAQIAPGRSGTSTMRSLGSQESWEALTAFGICFASRDRKAALELVSSRGGSPEEVATYKRLFRSQNQVCLGDVSEMRVDWPLVRGAVGEGLYRKAVPVPAELAVQTAPALGQIRNFGDAALCYAAANTSEAKALVATKVGSKAEAQAVDAAMQSIGLCVPEAAKRAIQIGPTLIRFRIAEALWKLGETPVQAPARAQ